MSFKMESELAALLAASQTNINKPTAFRLKELEEFLRTRIVPVESFKSMQSFQEKLKGAGVP